MNSMKEFKKKFWKLDFVTSLNRQRKNPIHGSSLRDDLKQLKHPKFLYFGKTKLIKFVLGERVDSSNAGTTKKKSWRKFFHGILTKLKLERELSQRRQLFYEKVPKCLRIFLLPSNRDWEKRVLRRYWGGGSFLWSRYENDEEQFNWNIL